MPFTLFDFALIIVNTSEVIRYLREKNLLKKTQQCCGKLCILIKDKTLKDEQIFKCTRCRKKKSIRYGSFFYKSKLSIKVLFTLCYLYIKDISIVHASRLLGDEVSTKSIIQWYTYFREVTSLYLRKNPIKFGTKVSIVQIDESYLGHQPKYFRGAWRGQQYMIFGIIDTVTKKCLIEIVPNCSKDELLPIIRKHIEPGSTIFTDGLSTYKCLDKEGYKHSACNHSEGEYVAPDGTNTNSIENLWCNLKSKFKMM